MSSSDLTDSPADPATTQTAPVKEYVQPEGAELQLAILKQVEFYFSEANLRKDAYLLSQMDSESYVPLATIARFGKLRYLTESTDLIIESIKDSTVVQLSEDNTRIKPREGERKTLIFHNLAPQTTTEDVEKFVKDAGYSVAGISEVANNWFVTFESEDKATEAANALRTLKLHDQQVRVRLKSETVNRSLYLTDPNVPVYPVHFPQPVNSSRGNFNPYYYGENNTGEFGNRNYDSNRSNRGYRKQRKDHRKLPFPDKRRTGRKKSRESKKANPTVPLGPSHFPPLPSANKETAGYTESFIKYNTEEIIEAIQSFPDFPKPDGLEDNNFTLSSPNNDLEFLKPHNVAEELQDGVPVRVPMAEVLKAKEGKPKNPNNSNDQQPQKTNDQQRKPSPKLENTKPSTATEKPVKGNERTWSEIVTKKAKDQEESENENEKEKEKEKEKENSTLSPATNAPTPTPASPTH